MTYWQWQWQPWKKWWWHCQIVELDIDNLICFVYFTVSQHQIRHISCQNSKVPSFCKFWSFHILQGNYPELLLKSQQIFNNVKWWCVPKWFISTAAFIFCFIRERFFMNEPGENVDYWFFSLIRRNNIPCVYLKGVSSSHLD